MSTPLIAVDPQKRGDMYQRYTMPAIITKIEGSGNGIKTVLPNIFEICTAINRPTEVLMKFFQFECGAQRTVSRNQKCLLMGQHQQPRIQTILDDFIVKFVLCSTCRSPETNFSLSNRQITSQCAACGNRRSMKDVHRVSTFMVNYYTEHQDELTKNVTKATGAAADALEPAAETAKAVSPTEAAPPAAAHKGEATGSSMDSQPVKDTEASPVTTTLNVLRELEKKYPNDTEQHNAPLSAHLSGYMRQYCLDGSSAVVILLLAFSEAYSHRMCEYVQKYHTLISQLISTSETEMSSASGDERKMAKLKASEKKRRGMVLFNTGKLFVKKFYEKDEYYSPEQLICLIFVFYIEGIATAEDIQKWSSSQGIVGDESGEYMKEVTEKIKLLHNWLGISAVEA